MLDPSEQAKMIQLLKHLQVAHDLSVVLRVQPGPMSRVPMIMVVR